MILDVPEPQSDDSQRWWKQESWAQAWECADCRDKERQCLVLIPQLTD